MSLQRPIKVVVYEDDPHLALMLEKMIQSFGYAISVYPDPSGCPVYNSPHDTCPKNTPCADIMIVNYRIPLLNGVELLEQQRQRGCKIHIENKAIMSTSVNSEQKKAIEALGCHFFSKPFRREELKTWLDTCAAHFR